MRRVLFAAAVAAVAGFATLPPGAKDDAPTFNRVASFYVCTQLDPTCNTDTETVAEIVAVTEDGYTAVYTDSPQEVRRSRCPTAFPCARSPIPPAGSCALASRTPLDSRHVRPRRRRDHPPLPTAGDRIRRHHEPSLATAAWHCRRGRRAHLRGYSWWLCVCGRQHQPRLCQPVGQARPNPHLVPDGHGRGRPRWPARRRCHLARRAVPRRRHRKRA